MLLVVVEENRAPVTIVLAFGLTIFEPNSSAKPGFEELFMKVIEVSTRKNKENDFSIFISFSFN